MRQAIRQSGRNLRATTFIIPPPIRGWNRRDSLDSMNKLDAVELTNMFPTDGDVKLRRGFTAHCTGLPSMPNTLVEFNAITTRKLIAAASTSIYDVTSSTAVSLATGFISDKWQSSQFDQAGTPLMGLVNGSDAPQKYDGTTVSAMAISGTGLVPANLDGINIFKSRSYFWDSTTQDFWYSSVNALGGTLTKFPLGRLSGLGGNLIAMGTWNIDGGDGVNDVAVFCMSSGSVIVYRGSDPGADFSEVGIFNIAPPLGIRAVKKIGSDLIITTQEGYVPMSKVLRRGRVDDKGAVSDRIRGETLEVTSAYKYNFGWDITLYPRGNMLIFNVPVSGIKYEQHVMNTNTRAWSKFTGMNGSAWATFNDELYFGGDGVVFKADNGLSDNGIAIKGIGQHAWSHLGIRGRQKAASLVRFIGRTQSFQFDYKLDLGVDFVSPKGVIDDFIPAITGTPWSSPWGSPWTVESRILERWESTKKIGNAFSPRLQVSSSTQGFDWISTGIVFKIGSLI